MGGHNYDTRGQQTCVCAHTHTHFSMHKKKKKSTHSHSIMLLSHSPWSHFSQSPRVCEGQSGLSSHKPGLHSRLPAKVCVSTKCNIARRNGSRENGRRRKEEKGEERKKKEEENPDDRAEQCSAGPSQAASRSSCSNLLEIAVYLAIGIILGREKKNKGCAH